MRNHWLGSSVALAALAGLCASAAAATQSPAEQAIEYRHSVYHVIAWNVTPMAAAVRGKAPYDPAAFAYHANRVALLASMLLEGFPYNSYVAGKTHAKPEVWSNRAAFEDLLKKLESRSATLAEVAKSGDLEKIKPAFNDLAQTCADCHKQFREKLED